MLEPPVRVEEVEEYYMQRLETSHYIIIAEEETFACVVFDTSQTKKRIYLSERMNLRLLLIRGVWL